MAGNEEHLVITLPFPEPVELIAKIKEAHPLLRITYRTIPPGRPRDDPELLDLWSTATIISTFYQLPPESRAQAPNLKLLHLFSAAYDYVKNTPLFTDPAVTIITSNGVHPPQVAEWALMTALIHAHHYNDSYENQKLHKWRSFQDGAPMVRDLAGQRVGILGYGSIGRQVARLCDAFGMDVIAYTARPRSTPESKRDNGYIVAKTGDRNGSLPIEWYSGTDKKSLHAFLGADLDMLFVCTPLDDTTNGLLGSEDFDVLASKTPFLVNIARGQIIQQESLITALAEGKLRGAALDVVDPEPLPPDGPLWDAKNIIISPHTSGMSSNYTKRALEVLQINLKKYFGRETLMNVVNKS